jgi:phenylacetic acid degradation operon negative regulatory protein
MRGIDYAEVLVLFLWGMDKLTRPTFGNLLAGYEQFEHHAEIQELLHRLTRKGLVRRTGRGEKATFVITPTGRARVRQLEPRVSWEEPWDGLWRVVTFDLPESQRRSRYNLWRALRARRFGLLQRSVWVWPRDVTLILTEMIHAEGIPECFCGFEAKRLLLCTNTEVVQAAWDFEEIGKRQFGYLEHPTAIPKKALSARNLAELAAVARAERQAYAYAVSMDPLLPRELWPRDYRGLRVQEKHEQFQQSLASRLTALVGE